MKSCSFFLFLFLSLLSSVALASEVKCYSSGVLIYQDTQKNKDLYVGEGFIIVRHKNEKSVVIADCVIRYKTKPSKK